MSKILITGGTGFVGSYLSKHLSDKYEVFLSSRKQVAQNILHLDLKDIELTKNIFESYRFEKIFHLTSQSSVHLSFKKPFETLYDNINTTLNLLKVVSELDYEPKVILASTSEVYKVSETELTEDSVFEPRNPYAISKIVTDYLVRNISKEFNIHSILLRLFNHTGPGQTDTFVLGSFSKQLAEMKLGLKEPIIQVGNLDVKRDFIDVRDVCRAYDLVSDDDSTGEAYNVCSGNEYVVKELLDMLIEISGLDVKVEVDPSRLRKIDIPTFYGSYKKIKESFGWEPQIPIKQTLQDMFNWWIENLRN